MSSKPTIFATHGLHVSVIAPWWRQCRLVCVTGGLLVGCDHDFGFLQGDSDAGGDRPAEQPDAPGSERGNSDSSTSEPDRRSVGVGSDHLCVRRGSGSVLCIGDNTLGQRGNATAGAVPAQQQLVWTAVTESGTAVRELGGALDLRSGDNHTCVVKGDSLWCWGTNDLSQIGRDMGETSYSAVRIQHPEDPESGSSPVGPGVFRSLSVGANHSCAIYSNVTYCWGRNLDHEIAGARPAQALPPVVIFGGYFYQLLALGDGVSFGLDQSGQVGCWGRNDLGQCGVAPSTLECEGSRCVQGVAPIPDATNAEAVFAGSEHACALGLTSREVNCWGNNSSLQALPRRPCDVGPCFESPDPVPEALGASRLALGREHSCALRQGEVLCWGRNDLLGHYAQPAKGFSAPLTVLREDGQVLTDVVDLDARGMRTCALTRAEGGTAEEAVWCWGRWDSLGHGWNQAHHLPW